MQVWRLLTLRLTVTLIFWTFANHFGSGTLRVAPLQVHTVSLRAFATMDVDREERVAGRGATCGGTSSNKSMHARVAFPDSS